MTRKLLIPLVASVGLFAILWLNRALTGTGMSLTLVAGDADIVVEGRPLGLLWKT